MGLYDRVMGSARSLLFCLVLTPACADESVPEPHPEPARTRSMSVACTDQPQLGDTWELELGASDIQLDAEGNVYLIDSDRPDCAPKEAFEGSSWSFLTKLGPRGDVRWVRGWEADGIRVAVSPSGEAMVLAREGGFLVDDDGSILQERRRGSQASAIAATSTKFLLAGVHYEEDPISFDRVTFEPTSPYGVFVIALDGDMFPRLMLERPPNDGIPLSPNAVVGLSDGDVVTAQLHEEEPIDTVITRTGAHPWRALAPTRSLRTRLFALADDSVVVQTGPNVSRFSSDGAPLWSRDYAGSLHANSGRFMRTGNVVAMSAAASSDQIVIAFIADPSQGALETSQGARRA